RYDRIKSFLEKEKKFSLLESKTLQSDLYSNQAKYYLDLLKENIPDTPSGRILKDWDLHYHPDSKGAFLFEKFLSTTYKNIFGKIFDSKTWDFINLETTIVADFYGIFDRILLNPKIEDLCWYPRLNLDIKLRDEKTEGEILKLIIADRDELVFNSLKETLRNYPIAKLRTWGKENSFYFNHLLFGEELPSWLPWNKGPFALPGCRSTICQGNLYRDRGRQSSYAPSYRMVTELMSEGIYTALPGGPSDRFYKKSYSSDISNWLNFNYKTLLPH
ncbi:MAG: penicillin acylase family protein, partial [Halobacteriovoraceae bacterium]|nr:penicillin acylase family protein [Halobacteriovoraceae bacterium]